MAPYLGDFPADQAVYFMWHTSDGNGASITRATDGTVSVYKDNSDGSSYDVTQVTTGVTDTEDFDGLTGVHSCNITTTDGWYETGHDYSVVLSAAVIDSQTVNAVLATFSIQNRYMRGTDSANTVVPDAAGVAATPAEVATAISDAGVNSTRMGYIDDLNAHSELSSIPAAGAGLSAKIELIFMALKNAFTSTATQQDIRNDAGTSIGSSTLSDDGTTLTKGEFS